MRPRILITLGDFNGIGPEVTLKAVTSDVVRRLCTPVLVGSIHVYEYYAKRYGMKVSFREIDTSSLTILPTDQKSGRNPEFLVIHLRQFQLPRVVPGKISVEAGQYAGEAIELAAKLCAAGMAEAIVTAPVSKEAVNAAGFQFAGQTEMLTTLCREPCTAMMVVADRLRVGLVTTHIPLRSITRSLNKRLVSEKLSVLHAALKNDFGIPMPRIATLGLNPHAGENGLLGDEERKKILPAITAAKLRRIRVEGPFAADGFFGSRAYKRYDGVLAMYHDQGLIPLKLLGFETGVNFTAGLPIVRTSPDHGTAFDLAGEGTANPKSMIEAIRLAVQISRNRQKRGKR